MLRNPVYTNAFSFYGISSKYSNEDSYTLIKLLNLGEETTDGKMIEKFDPEFETNTLFKKIA